ncbi:alpha/beta hydrolase [Thermodesulfobacteriota bacterium]
MTTSFGYAKLDQPEVLSILFHPRKESPQTPPDGVVDLQIPVDDGVEIGARLFLAGEEDPNILFFHGNGETIYDYDSIGPYFSAVGLNFLAVDYRGYGNSTGEPGAASMLRDAHVILKEMKQWLKDHNRTGPIVVMGRSLGSASALELAGADEGDIAGLIIESGFSHTLPLLINLGLDIRALEITEADGFKNLQKISGYPKPTLIVHAQNDQIIPLTSAEILQVHSPAKSKEYQVVPGADHNTIFEVTGKMYFEAMKRFTNKITGVKPTRYVSRRRK